MSWCLSEASALNFSPGLSQRSIPSTFLAPAKCRFRTSVTSPCGVFTRGSLLVSINVSMGLGLNPNSAVHALPPKVVRGAVQDRCFETVGRLEFEIEQRRLGGPQAMFILRRDEYHVSRAHVAHALFRFDGPFPFHDEIKMLAIFVEMIGRRGSLLVVHDPRQQVVDVGELLVDEEGALAARHYRNQFRELILVENVCHSKVSYTSCSTPDAIRAPSAMASSFAHITVG